MATPIVLAFALGVGLWAAWYYRKFPALLTQRFPWLIRPEGGDKDLTSVSGNAEGSSSSSDSGGKPGYLATLRSSATSLKNRVTSLCSKRKKKEGEGEEEGGPTSSTATSSKKKKRGVEEDGEGEDAPSTLGRVRAVLGSALTAAVDLFHSLIKRISELFARLRGGKGGGEDAPGDGAELDAAETAVKSTGAAGASAKGLALRNVNVVNEEGEGEEAAPRAQASPEALSWFKSLPRSTRLYLRGKGAVSNAGGTLDTPFPLDAVAREEIEALVGDGTDEFIDTLVEFGYAFTVRVVASGGGRMGKDAAPSLPHAPESRDEDEED